MIDTNYIDPIVVEITLYRHNWKDNQIISALKHSTDLFSLPQDPGTFLVSKQEAKQILQTRFAEEIIDINSKIGDETLFRHVNSLFFLNNMVNNFKNLKYFRIKISNDRNYSRYKKSDNIINFEYRVKYARVDLTQSLNKSELNKVKELLRVSGILSKSKIHRESYLSISVSELFDKFGLKENGEPYFTEYFDETITMLLTILTEKLELDNTNILLIIES